MSRERLVKIGKWTGIGLGAVVLILCGWLAFAWFGAGGRFEGELEDLVPLEAVVVVRMDQPSKVLKQLDEAIGALAVNRPAFREVEASPLWRSLFDPAPKTAAQLQSEIRTSLVQAEQAVASIPVLGLDLHADFLADEAVFALMPKAGSAERPWLALTRISKSVDFGLGFSGFATGDRGNASISELGGVLTITQAGKPPVHVASNGDVLVASSERSLVSKAMPGASGRRGGFSGHPRLGDARRELDGAGKGTLLRVFVNLGAVRAELGADPRDPEGRSKIDTYFSVSPEVARLSPEIMPSVSALMKRALDTRLYDMAAWNVDLRGRDGVTVDQFLLGDSGLLDTTYSYLKPTLTAQTAPMEFLKLLPEDTWAVVSDRLPFGSLQEAIKPGTNPDGSPKKDAVAAFLANLGENPPVDSVGVALLGRRLSPDPVRDAERKPPPAVSPVTLPGFALFLHWPGVTTPDAEAMMRQQLTAMGATNLFPTTRFLASGETYVAFEMRDDQELLRWLLDFACFAVADHMVFVYSPMHAAVGQIIGAAKGAVPSLMTAGGTPWGSGMVGQDHSALVYVSPQGLGEYSDVSGLPFRLAEQKHNPNTPFGKELRDLRKEIAEEMTRARGRPVDWLHSDVEQEMLKRQREWVAMAKPYEAEVRGNIRAFAGAMKDFTAHTVTRGAVMHTRFVVRLK